MFYNQRSEIAGECFFVRSAALRVFGAENSETEVTGTSPYIFGG